MPALTALTSMGQFSFEAAALGLMLAFSWAYARGRTCPPTAARALEGYKNQKNMADITGFLLPFDRCSGECAELIA